MYPYPLSPRGTGEGTGCEDPADPTPAVGLGGDCTLVLSAVAEQRRPQSLLVADDVLVVLAECRPAGRSPILQDSDKTKVGIPENYITFIEKLALANASGLGMRFARATGCITPTRPTGAPGR